MEWGLMRAASVACCAEESFLVPKHIWDVNWSVMWINILFSFFKNDHHWCLPVCLVTAKPRWPCFHKSEVLKCLKKRICRVSINQFEAKELGQFCHIRLRKAVRAGNKTSHRAHLTYLREKNRARSFLIVLSCQLVLTVIHVGQRWRRGLACYVSIRAIHLKMNSMHHRAVRLVLSKKA